MPVCSGISGLAFMHWCHKNLTHHPLLRDVIYEWSLLRKFGPFPDRLLGWDNVLDINLTLVFKWGGLKLKWQHLLLVCQFGKTGFRPVHWLMSILAYRSSIHVYDFLEHAAWNSATCMTSCVQFRICKSWSFRTVFTFLLPTTSLHPPT